MFPTDPADLFAHLIAQLEANFDSIETFGWMQDSSVHDIADLLERAAINDGAVESDSIEDLLDAVDHEDTPRRLFAILVGLDRALLYANPYYGSFDQGALTRIAKRYALTGLLNADISNGAVLPRAAFPGRRQYVPNSLGDAFVGVTWVPPTEWRTTTHVRLRPRNDLSRVERQGVVTVACMPFMDDPADLEWSVIQRNAATFYRIALKTPSLIAQNVERRLAELDVSGANIAVLPELALTEEVLASWIDAVERSPRPTESNLKWIFVGSGDLAATDPPSNRCALIDRVTGEVLFEQDKLYPFTLTPEQLREWKLSDFLGDELIEEDITRGVRICVAESSLGRLAILICEDLARIVDLGPRLRSHGVSHIFSPLFSKEVKPHHWEHQKAKEYAGEVGALVVVSNSLVVSRLSGTEGPWGASMVHSPVTSQIREATNPNDVAIFRVEAGDPAPLERDVEVQRADDDA